MPTLGHGKICYLEIPADDVASLANFYKQVFNWNVRTRSDGSTAFDDGVEEVSGSFVTGKPPARNPGIMIAIMVDNAEDTIRRIEANGGTILQGIGAHHPEITATFSDPYGNVFVIFQERSTAP